MKEVKQAWSSLLSSRNSMSSGTATGNNNNSCDNGSRATWYDVPVPVIIHGRAFQEESMESLGKGGTTEMRSEPTRVNGKEKSSNGRRLSKDSGIETIASLRRTFLDDFRRSNGSDEDRVEDAARQAGNVPRGEFPGITVIGDANSAKSGDPGKNNDGESGDRRAGGTAGGEEVLYQNNVEAALNGLSKICAEEVDVGVESSNSRNATGEDPARENDSDGSNGSGVALEGRRRRRRSSVDASRRHSSSLELTAMTTVKTSLDGVPTISFSFLRSEEHNARPFIRDIPLDDPNEVEMSLEVTEEVIHQDFYDIPKRATNRRVSESDESSAKDESERTEARTKSEREIELPERALGDGGQDSPSRLYDFPKNRKPELPAKSPKIRKNAGCSIEKVGASKSVCSIPDERQAEADRLYESPGDALISKTDKKKSSTLGNLCDFEAGRSEGVANRRREPNKRSSRSLRSGRSVGRIETLDLNLSSKDIQGYYSDPECQDASGNMDGSDNEDGAKMRKRHRLGKAWGKMRSWLREEKSRLGEVVSRHARMQAVGAVRGAKPDGPSIGSRTGSYDLVEARAKELGGITRVEEYGLSSVSEEANASDSDRAECSSNELRPDDAHRREINNHPGVDLDDDDDDDDVDEEARKNHRRKSSKLSRFSTSDDCPDGELASRLEKENATSRMKLTPVSLSADKLCIDELEEGNGGVVARRDGEPRDYVGKGGLIKRRMLGSIRGLMASTHLLQQHDSEEGGPGGFEDVRRYVKQGGDFCKELAAILHERAELEASYSKGLSKLSSKLTKACAKDQSGNGSGGVTEAWRSIGEEMEAAAEAHRAWGVALSEQLAKPLRVGVAEAQGRSRKMIESSVDKASKSLQEWRGIAAKSKKQSFACARENERLQDLARIHSISQSQQNNNKTSSHQMTEKEANKLETRRRKAEDSSRRADTEFYTVSVRAERARLEYESTVRKGAKQMELLEEERLSALKDLANVYLAHLQALAPRLQQSADRLSSPVRNCSVSQDVDILKNIIRRLDSNDGSNVDQLLPDFYAEHVTLAMNRERRKQSLVRVLHLIRQDLERERRGREGLETLHRAFIQTPAFAADESTQNVTEKLHHMRSMLTFLEAARYKVGGALAEIEGGKKGKHPLAEHILVSRDKQGLQQSVLKVPLWAKNESFEFPEAQEELEIDLSKVHESERSEWVDRTAGDGNSENPPDEEDFSDFDGFSSQSEDNNNQEVEITDMADKTEMIEQCRAIYQYSANLNDELSLTPGDLITIHVKQADGWWIGECAGRTGIFPATYVQLIH